MNSRVVTKIGDVFQTKSGRLLQLVAIDKIALNSDVVVVYDTSVQSITDISEEHISFYHHTTVSEGVKDGLWNKIGKCILPNRSKLVFKQFFSVEDSEADIAVLSKLPRLLRPKSRAYWTVWRANDIEWKKVSGAKGIKIIAEDSGITPAQDILYRIAHKKSQFKSEWPTI